MSASASPLPSRASISATSASSSLALVGREALGGAARGVPLELHAHVGDRREVGDVDLRGEGAAARIDRDEALERQALDRLAHRRAAHLELAPERVLVDRRARRDGQRDDAVAQLGVGAIGEQLAGAPQRQGWGVHRPLA